MRIPVLSLLISVSVAAPAVAQRIDTPLVQATSSASTSPLSLRDASRDDRWLGLGVRDVRWAPDGSVVYFRWSLDPDPDDVPEEDPWFRADRDGDWVEEVVERDEIRAIPGTDLVWSPDGGSAAWSSDDAVFLSEGGRTRAVATLGTPVESVRFYGEDRVDIGSQGALYRYDIASGTLTLLARAHEVSPGGQTTQAEWLARQQRDVFEHVREQAGRRARRLAAGRALAVTQALPVQPGDRVDAVQVSPDGRYLTYRVRTPATDRPSTKYIDYVDESGYSTVLDARSKVGESRDLVRMGIVPFAPGVHPDSVTVTWVTLDESGDQNTIPHGPYWSVDGLRGLVQFIGEDHQDVWIAELDPATGRTRLLAHDHDDAWIGGPPVQANYLQPALLEWLPDGSWVFASERTGWSHLYRVDPAGAIMPLTRGDWEVRGASLDRSRSAWILQASREHPSDDHLYTMPAAGGELSRITDGVGRNEGWISPDGGRLAVVHSTTTSLPDLFVGGIGQGGRDRVTVSGSENFHGTELVTPTVVSFDHPDGDPIWAALYQPSEPHPDRPAVIHVHGGGYRQFAHRGWSVYGWALHVGFVSYLVQEGYTVLDFDYRGGAGFGRDYRADVARSMGIKDADGVAAAAAYLAREHGVDPTRIGMHGVSYGGFLTLMTLFRHPGVVTAGIARASVTDWAHYSDGWTSRILGVPADDGAAYERSSPIYYADGLEDHLLITHGIMDDNVHFQDAARLVQRLIELEKDFEVMVYPVEPHTIETEASRYDFVRRAMGFFERHLTGER